MTKAVCISATLLDGRYHGEEWPPSPARLFQAMLAGVMTGSYRTRWRGAQSGFQWLEERGDPIILARPVLRGCEYKLAVPNNDLDVIARVWAAGKHADAATIRTMKLVRPRIVDAHSPHLRYMWPIAEEEDVTAVIESLRPLSRSLYALGWGVDMAYADVDVDGDDGAGPWDRWVPVQSAGEQLMVPTTGFLKDLEETYARFIARAKGTGVDANTRPTVYRLQRYALADSLSVPYIAFELRTKDGEETLRRPWHRAMEVAAWMRHGAGERLRGERFGEDVDSYISGHVPEGEDASHRMSFLPLPSIGHADADGAIRRVLFAEPRGGSGRAIELLAMKLPGVVLRGEGYDACSLSSLPDRRVVEFYTGTSRVWRSVTPVVLHGYNKVRHTISLGKTEALLRRAFEMAGYSNDEIEHFVFQEAPLWPGTDAASNIRVPAHLSRFPRYHVQVRFNKMVSGPVTAGIGRHCGIGVFAVARS